MAINPQLKPDGTSWFRVTVVAKHKKNRALKVQKERNYIPTLAEAKRIEKQLKTQANEELLKRAFDGLKWNKTVELWSSHIQSNLFARQKITESTASDYIFLISEYTKRWNNIPTKDILPAQIEQLYEKLEVEKSISTAKRMRAALNSIFKWAISNGKISINPVLSVQIKSTPKERLPEVLSIAEVHKLFEAGEACTHSWYEIWVVAILTGMRNGELHALRWNRVDFVNRLITVELSYNTKLRKDGPTKGRCWRKVPINDKLYRFLQALKSKTGHTEHVLPRSNDWDKGYQARILRHFCKQIKISSVKFHALRATFATHLLNSGVPEAKVQKICGWKDRKTMDHYIDLASIHIQGLTNSLPITLPDSSLLEIASDLVP